MPDLEAAVEFYGRALALRPGRRLFGGSAAEMLGASSNIYLVVSEAGSSPSTEHALPRAYVRHWTPVHLDFEVDDVAQAVAQAVTAGARLEGDIRSFDWGRLATLSDPFGNGFCLLQFTGAGYDAAP